MSNAGGEHENPNVISRLEGKKAIQSFARKLEEPDGA